MPVGKILASVTGSARDSAVLGYAIAAARPFHAHVEAFFVRPDLGEAIAFFNDGVSAAVVDEVLKASREAADEAGKRVQTALTEVCARYGIQCVDAPQRSREVTLSFREMQGNLGDQLTAAARFSDMVVLGPLHDGEKVGLAEAFVQVLVETDRPVLLATKTAPDRFPQRVAIGWDGKTAASLAVSAAIPYLAQADSVEILSVQRGSSNPQALDALKVYLALHGVECGVKVIDPGPKSIGEVLLEAATAGGADLLVAGGYGHSRLRESLVGGVTRHVVLHAKLPVFMVH